MLDDGSEEAYTDEILNSPLHQLDLGKIQKYPRIREFFIRNGSLYNSFCVCISENFTNLRSSILSSRQTESGIQSPLGPSCAQR